MMIRNTLLPVVVLVGLLGVFTFVSPTGAQNATPPVPARVAICNPARVFNEMQETKDLKVKLEAERRTLEETERQKRQRLQEIQDQLKLLKSDSPQFNDKNRELTQAAIEFQAWGQITQQELQNAQKNQMKQLFDKIQAATALVAQQRGFDLVFADQRPDFPENLAALNVDQLRALINQRNILYATPSVDLSSDVTALLDTQYKTPSAPR